MSIGASRIARIATKLSPMSLLLSEDELERRVEERTAELVAALRGSEARFRALIENSIDVTGILDADQRMQYVSPSVTRILGYSVDELVGSTSLEFIHPDDEPILQELFTRTIDDQAVMTPQFRARHKDGSWRLMEAVGLNLLDDPAVRGMVVTARDVTARRGLEQRLRQSERLEAIGQLAGGVAHDFNNVLLVIRGYSSVLRTTLTDPQQIADVDEIANAADRATQLTRQLLAFGRRQVLEPHKLNLDDVVLSMQKLLRRTMPADIEIDVELADGVTPVVADPAQLEAVIVNLAFNARDALSDGGGAITFSVDEASVSGAEPGIDPPLAPGRYVRLAVGDDGPGIPEDVLPHIFEPFFTTKEAGLGTGLGLSSVYGIVAQSGGGVEVGTSHAGGAQFTIYLPAAAGSAEDSEAAAVATSLPPGTETILLVEDEAPVRELIRRVLESAGYVVLVAGLPSEAERLLEDNGHIDLLLTDVVMPEMSGYDLALRVTELRPYVRRLFISGYAPRVQLVKGPLLKKPFAPEELARAVRAALDDNGRLEIA
jgi:two-component system, cell cycle sensor histidine kinase and response regulator CckA